MITERSNWVVTIDADYVPHFSAVTAHDDGYHRLLSQSDSILKDERMTSVMLLSRSSEERHGERSRFVLKVYRFPGIAALGTLMRTSIAEREYRGLRQCRTLDIPAARPVGFGIEKGIGRTLRSCFVITGLVENSVDLRAWLKQCDGWNSERHEQAANIMRQLGLHLHRLHEQRFFLMRPTPRNILLLKAETRHPEPLFIDQPYARFFRSRLRAGYGQRMDLGQLFGSFLRYSSEDILDPFLETYMPDPFGRTSDGLKQLILRAAAVHDNRTLVSSITHQVHRFTRRLGRT